MSLYGITKGTALEKVVDQYAEAEGRGVGMYCGLALLAKEQGYEEVAEVLLKLAQDEARHAGLYAVLNGRIPQDLFVVLAQIAPRETEAESKIKAYAQQARELGLETAARHIEEAAEDEGNHGKVLNNLVDKFSHAAQQNL